MDPDSSLTEKQQLFYDFTRSVFYDFTDGAERRTLQGIIEKFGPPSKETGPFQRTLPEECGKAVFHYTRSFEFDHVAPLDHTFVVSERSTGELDFSFRPPGL